MSAPRFDLDLTPFRDADGWAGIDVRYTAEFESIPAGQPILRLPKIVASVPGAPYRPEDLSVTDASGRVSLTEVAGTEDPMSSYRHFIAERDVQGSVEVAVRAPVRDVDLRTPVGPLFDLRREHLGLFGSGVTFVPVPLSEEREFDFSITWHLDDGVTAVSSRGVGDEVRRWSGVIESIEHCLFGAGTPIISPEGATNFAIHAYSDVPFDLDALSTYLRDIHTAMSEFFEDEEPQYHVLVRRNPDKGSGGTSFPSSFAFGYSPTSEVDESDLRTLLAHEMVHNWPRLDEDWTVGSWYTEGAAEFYSLVLPWRAGILSSEVFAEQLSEMYRRYDANPRRHLAYADAADLFWADLRAQTVPYGRGIQYLVHVDAQLRASSNGTISLDDIVLDIQRAQRRGEKVRVEGWLQRIEPVLGERARAEYQAMVDGEPVPRPTGLFQGALQAHPAIAPEHELGFDIASFQGEPRLVVGLVAGSAAADAGLRDGDELVTRRFSYSAVRDGSTPLELVIRRDGVEQTIRYEPRGRDVPTTDWLVAE